MNKAPSSTNPALLLNKHKRSRKQTETAKIYESDIGSLSYITETSNIPTPKAQDLMSKFHKEGVGFFVVEDEPWLFITHIQGIPYFVHHNPDNDDYAGFQSDIVFRGAVTKAHYNRIKNTVIDNYRRFQDGEKLVEHIGESNIEGALAYYEKCSKIKSEEVVQNWLRMDEPVVPLLDIGIEVEAGKELDSTICSRYNAIAYYVGEKYACVAMGHTDYDLETIEAPIEAKQSEVWGDLHVRYANAVPSQANEYIESQRKIASQIEKQGKSESYDPETLNYINLDRSNLDNVQLRDITKTLDFLAWVCRRALKRRASDLHIEPTNESNKYRARVRIDGSLQEIAVFNRDTATEIASKLKGVSELDQVNRRTPQDGKFNIVYEGSKSSCRLSTLPASTGESIAIRFNREQKSLAKIEDLDMPHMIQKQYTSDLKKSYGLFLNTGPTGSGKTQTLNVSLKEVMGEQEKVITIEDPVELALPGATQIQVNNDKGLNFANILRSCLRHDPDIVMVGEIRDQETAEIAVQAANTGHLIFTTLHTNNAVSAIPRLIELGISPLVLTNCLSGIIAQRLAKRVCRNCSSLKPLDGDDLEFFRKVIRVTFPEPKPFSDLLPTEQALFKDSVADRDRLREKASEYLAKTPMVREPEGCGECAQTGYRGRKAIIEYLPMSTSISEMVGKGCSTREIEEAYYNFGYCSLSAYYMESLLDENITFKEACSHWATVV